jgi:tryptophan synthase alpha chain
MKKNAKVAAGFLYCTARQGTTGVKDSLDPAIGTYLKNVRKYFSMPIAVGFGISQRKHLKMLAPYADIAIIGSAIIDVINQSKPEAIEKNLEQFLLKLRT